MQIGKISVKILAAAGSIAISTAKILSQIAKKEKEGVALTPGETKLKDLVQNGNVQLWTLDQDKLKAFSKRANDYGLPFCVIGKKEGEGHLDGYVDIAIPQERSNIMLHIIENFEFTAFAKQSGETQIDLGRSNLDKINVEDIPNAEPSMQEQFDIKGEKEENPKENLMEKETHATPSENSSKNQKENDGKFSVRKEFEKLKDKRAKGEFAQNDKTIQKDNSVKEMSK